jgi:hypothetical protein
LKTKARPNPRDEWVLVEGAFRGIVDQATFDRAQRAIRQRLNYKSDKVVLRELRALWKRRGTLSESIINGAKGVPAVSGLRHRFGNMAKVYELLGFQPAPSHGVRTAKSKMMLQLRAQVFACIRESFPYDVTFTRPSSRYRCCIEFADVGRVNVVLCRSFDRPEGLRYWMMYVRAATRDLPGLVCLMAMLQCQMPRPFVTCERHFTMPAQELVLAWMHRLNTLQEKVITALSSATASLSAQAWEREDQPEALILA